LHFPDSHDIVKVFLYGNTFPESLEKETAYMDSILQFWNQMTANPLLFIAVTLTLGVILVNGWTDAPTPLPPAW